MGREGHLRLLRLFHYILATVFYLIAFLFVMIWVIPGLIAIVHGQPIGWMFLVGGLFSGGLATLLADLHRRSATAAIEGRRRILQTTLAILHFCNVPIGTAFAVYTLYLCWFHQPTKVFFDVHDSRL